MAKATHSVMSPTQTAAAAAEGTTTASMVVTAATTVAATTGMGTAEQQRQWLQNT